MRMYATAAAICAATMGPVSAMSSPPDWMEGHWLSCDGGVQTAETWVRSRSGLLAGLSISDSGFEFLRIAETDGVLSYIASPGGGPATAFTLVSNDGSKAVFENKAHDFPQRIVYVRAGDALTATIEGDVEGRTQSMQWRYRAAPSGAVCGTAE
ncbi:MAG: DUF6265 family protein [Pseudomonadota bacterium]|nr:DUF6265 family protein [Pseudomonadota bacterium]